MLNKKIIEIIEGTGKIRKEDIIDIAELQAELNKAGYISYLDPSTDYLIIKKRSHIWEESKQNKRKHCINCGIYEDYEEFFECTPRPIKTY